MLVFFPVEKLSQARYMPVDAISPEAEAGKQMQIQC